MIYNKNIETSKQQAKQEEADMKFENKLSDYATENQILKAYEYLKNAVENMEDRLEKMTGLDVFTENSHASFFSNYIEISDPETCETVFKIRVSDHTNNEGWYAQDVDIRINGRYWRDVKSEILSEVKKRFS